MDFQVASYQSFITPNEIEKQKVEQNSDLPPWITPKLKLELGPIGDAPTFGNSYMIHISNL